MRQADGCAIVLGASVSGLLAARVLSDHYAEVILLERDRFPPPGEYRRGVPQARHLHALLARGRRTLEGFFPGFTRELEEQGGLPITLDRLRWYAQGVYHRPSDAAIKVISISRPRLEAQIRSRVSALPNVRVIEGCDALALVTSGDRSAVTGVRIIRREPGSPEEILNADLVVDATGRGSRSPAWLADLGYDRPEEEEFRVDVGYASRIYRRRPEDLDGCRVALYTVTPPARRSASLLALEGDRWMVTLGGYLGDYPPTDEAGFLEFARSLPVPDVYELIRHAEPLSEIAPHRFPASRRRRYERLERFPEGYLVFGDAICSFNPVYGQGMTAAAMQAEVLQGCLSTGDAGLARRFFRQVTPVLDIPWQMAVSNDLRFAAVAGRRSGRVRLIHWYMPKLHIAAQWDSQVSLAFRLVADLEAPPTSILHPRIALRVLWGNLRNLLFRGSAGRALRVPAAGG